jgi:alpha-N-arabinofuranosidase
MGYPSKDMKICFDEWNVWDESKAPGAAGLEQWYDYTDLLGFCAWLNVLVRKHKDIGIACLAQSVNVVSRTRMVSRTDVTTDCSDLASHDQAGRNLQADHLLPVTRSSYCRSPADIVSLRLFCKYMKNGHLLQLPRMPDV